jgi:F-type H+-transporting ATPase subunit b
VGLGGEREQEKGGDHNPPPRLPFPKSSAPMNASIFLAAATGSNPAVEIAEKFGFNAQIFFMHVVGFAIVMWALHRWAYKPVLQMLDERKERIAKSMADADKMKAELASAQAKAQEIIGQASAASNKIIEEARNAAAKVTETETQKAVAAAQEIINKARQANEAELAKMKADLRKEIGTLAVKAAMQVTGKVLTADDQKRLANETNQQLAA